MSRCVTLDQFRRLLGGQLTAAEREALEAHVDACTPCQETLTRLLDDSHDDPAGVDWRRRVSRTAPTAESGADFLRRLEDGFAPDDVIDLFVDLAVRT